jgi:hypothetical protein
MKSDSTKGNEIIVKAILLNNQFGIIEVRELENLWSGYFDESTLKEVEVLIKSGNMKTLELLKRGRDIELGWIDVVKFKDQVDREYYVTVYEGFQFWQYPQIVEIYLL